MNDTVPESIKWRGLVFNLDKAEQRASAAGREGDGERNYVADNGLVEVTFWPADPDSRHVHEHEDHWTAQLWNRDDPLSCRDETAEAALEGLVVKAKEETAEGMTELSLRMLDLMDEFSWLTHLKEFLSKSKEWGE